MKKFLLTVLCFILGCLGLVACADKDPVEPPQTVEHTVAYYAVVDDGTAKTTTSIPAGMYKSDGNYPAKYVEGKGATISELQNYTEGEVKYTFDGWFSDEACETAFAGIGTDAKADVKVYAKITKGAAYVTKSIAYKAVLNGVEMEIPQSMFQTGGSYPTTYKVGQTATISDLQDVSEYTFEGWFADKDCETAFTGVIATDNADITVYAKLAAAVVTPENKTITYIAIVDGATANGGAAIINSMKKQDGNYPDSYRVGEATTISDLTDTADYDFIGWYTNAACTVAFTGITATDNADITVYAKIETIETVHSDIEYFAMINGSKTSIPSVLYKDSGTYATQYEEGVGATVSDLKSSVTEGTTKYTFGGWYMDEACTQAFSGTISATQTGKVTLYAKITSETVEDTDNDEGSWTKNY